MQPISGIELARELLEAHEGRRRTLYRCSEGLLTIGVGHNIQQRGLREDEIDLIFDNDLREAEATLKRFDWFHELNAARQAAAIDMMFQLGAARFSKFKKMIACLAAGDFAGASREALDSLYAQQVPRRANRIATIIESGVMY